MFHIVYRNLSYTPPLSLCGLSLLTDFIGRNINYLSCGLFLLNSYQKGKQRAGVRGIFFKLFISSSSPAVVFSRCCPLWIVHCHQGHLSHFQRYEKQYKRVRTNLWNVTDLFYYSMYVFSTCSFHLSGELCVFILNHLLSWGAWMFHL